MERTFPVDPPLASTHRKKSEVKSVMTRKYLQKQNGDLRGTHVQTYAPACEMVVACGRGVLYKKLGVVRPSLVGEKMKRINK